jgi:hypothetical protein
MMTLIYERRERVFSEGGNLRRIYDKGFEQPNR